MMRWDYGGLVLIFLTNMMGLGGVREGFSGYSCSLMFMKIWYGDCNNKL